MSQNFCIRNATKKGRNTRHVAKVRLRQKHIWSTYDPKTKMVPFLDMKISVDNHGYIQTDLYRKDTDRIQYLLPSSCHPAHVTRNIPYSLAYRILRICSKPEWLRLRLEELRGFLLARQYNPKVVQVAFDRVLSVKREDALRRVERQKEKREAMIITFHPSLPSISSVIRKHWRVMISTDQDLKQCFSKPSVVAYRRSKNLKDILVKAKIEPKNNTRRRVGFQRCRRACIMCHHAIPTLNHINSSGKTFNIHSYIDCTSNNVIYKLSCNKCNSFLYIGETSRRACDRFQEHRGYINQKNLSQPAGEHFNLPGHSSTDLRIQVIEEVKSTDPFVRKTRETFWIKEYNATKLGNNIRKWIESLLFKQLLACKPFANCNVKFFS